MSPTVTVLKALSDRNRLRTIYVLSVYDELCACRLAGMLGISAATVSRHMGILLSAKLVTARKDGRWMHYRLVSSCDHPVLSWVKDELSGDLQAAEDIKYLKDNPSVDQTLNTSCCSL